ncbi:MAG: hypothetical protein AAF549_04585 [Pseudomonadota bacterium]
MSEYLDIPEIDTKRIPALMVGPNPGVIKWAKETFDEIFYLAKTYHDLPRSCEDTTNTNSQSVIIDPHILQSRLSDIRCAFERAFSDRLKMRKPTFTHEEIRFMAQIERANIRLQFGPGTMRSHWMREYQDGRAPSGGRTVSSQMLAHEYERKSKEGPIFY